MVRFHFFAQFPGDQLPHPVVSIGFMHVCSIRLLYDWSFSFCQHISFCWVLTIFGFNIIIMIITNNNNDNNNNSYYYYYYYYYYYTFIRAFYISVSRWFFIGVWVTASLLKSPGLFLVFWPFSIMLSFGWSPLVRQLPSPLVPLVIL